MPGWKKNIPACLQPDQEGGKTRTGPEPAGSHRPAGERPSLGVRARVEMSACSLIISGEISPVSVELAESVDCF